MGFKKTQSNFGDRGKTRNRDNNRFSDKKSYGSRKPGSVQLYDVTCSQCGKRTQVPFKPTGEKPVLCRECFRGDNPGRPAASRHAQRTAQTDSLSEQLREINDKLDAVLALLGRN